MYCARVGHGVNCPNPCPKAELPNESSGLEVLFQVLISSLSRGVQGKEFNLVVELVNFPK